MDIIPTSESTQESASTFQRQNFDQLQVWLFRRIPWRFLYIEPLGLNPYSLQSDTPKTKESTKDCRYLKWRNPHLFLALVGGWTNPFEKYAQVKLDRISPGKIRVKIKNTWVATTYISCMDTGYVRETNSPGFRMKSLLASFWFNDPNKVRTSRFTSPPPPKDVANVQPSSSETERQKRWPQQAVSSGDKKWVVKWVVISDLSLASWWFPPIWKILVKFYHFPK